MAITIEAVTINNATATIGTAAETPVLANGEPSLDLLSLIGLSESFPSLLVLVFEEVSAVSVDGDWDAESSCRGPAVDVLLSTVESTFVF